MFEIGKIPSKVLDELVMRTVRGGQTKRDDIVLRPEIGEDCSAIDVGGELCVFSTDPITGAAQNIGYLAVQINCNDIFSSGAEPVGILLTILLPPGSEQEDLQEIMAGAVRAADELDIEILGGHTEVTAAVCQPLISATVFGKSHGKTILRTGAAQAGQDVVMTKWAGLEGTAILAKDYEALLLQVMSQEPLTEAQEMSRFLSVGEESRVALAHGASAMHDATEGGVLGAIWEMAACSGRGVTVFADDIPIREETKTICEIGRIDPLRLISSGVMVIATYDGEGLVKALEASGIHGAVVGKITENSDRIYMREGKRFLLEEPGSDALYQVDFSAVEKMRKKEK